ncbi:MAG: hypothetical protein HC849_26930 [Oscillatoriales cyanobacterium RU_3_3]|nr:hypothetical protein [Oscillatoriales cyanobacterium RU_3_3]
MWGWHYSRRKKAEGRRKKENAVTAIFSLFQNVRTLLTVAIPLFLLFIL